ncbi:MAG: LysM peptidoglycan-binding domain-containing protein [Schleiferiaceae bacterium]|jgi:hypothetical protein|nr:LysM peptidoglycan-binding domain-containing protein [Schleiferiaceae bacterium]
MFGMIEKMKIYAYNAEDFESSSLAGQMDVTVNPNSYNYNYALVYDEQQAAGSSSANLRFQGIRPVDISFDFLFDGTGVLSYGIPSSIEEQIKEFQHLVLRYEGEIHRPKYIKLAWGSLLFKGVLKELKLEYKLFDNGGKPLRAVATCSFTGSVDDDLRVAQENAQSPDLTHVKMVKPKENLPLMVYKVYKETEPFIEVAKFNELETIRGLKDGMELKFPPKKNE